MKCPNCGIENDDNWPIEVDGKILDGGCNECWADQVDAEWWKNVITIDKIINKEYNT